MVSNVVHSGQVAALRVVSARTVRAGTGAVRCVGSQRSAGRIIAAAACLLSGPSLVDHCVAGIAGRGLVRLGQRHTWVACFVNGFILSLLSHRGPESELKALQQSAFVSVLCHFVDQLVR